MQTSFSCSLEAATPQALHRCPRPLRCRTFRALPLSGCSQDTRLSGHVRAQSRATGIVSLAGPARGFLNYYKSDSPAQSAYPSTAGRSSTSGSSKGVTYGKHIISAASGSGSPPSGSDSNAKPSNPAQSSSSSTAGSASKSSSGGSAASKKTDTSKQSTSSPSTGSSVPGGPNEGFFGNERVAKSITPATSPSTTGPYTPITPSTTSPAATGATAPGPNSSASSNAFSEKTVDVSVYDPSGGPYTERRKVKVDRRQTGPEEDAESAIDNTTEAVQGGVNQAADAVEKGTDQLAEGVSDVADQVEDQVEQGADRLQEAAEDFGEQLEDAADAAEQQLSNATEQLQGAAQGAANSAQNLAESLQRGAQSGSPYKDTPLSAMEASPYEGPGRKPSKQVQSDYYKLRLLECIAGLDRGFAANSYATMQVESAALALTEQSDPVQLSWTPASDKEDKPSGLAQISGTWRLVYSSGFASGGIGGRQAGPPAGLLPRLGQVYQVISPYTSGLDNVLELYSGFPGLEPVVLTASLKHHFEALGGNIVQITFEDTEVKVTGGIGGLLGNLPDIMLPQLPEPFKPSRQQRTSSFDVLFLDNDLRITRGSRGELRIFVKT